MKRSYLLLEVLISLSLISVILISLFHFFTQINLVRKNMEITKEIVFERAHVQQRLTHIFSHLQPNNAVDPSFRTDKKHLYFQFENGIDPDPSFSGVVRGEIFFLPKTKQIVLRLLPLEEKKTKIFREEILATSVDSPQLLYFSKKEGCFVSSWKQTFLPPMIKLSFTKGTKEKISFCFFTLSETNIIVY